MLKTETALDDACMLSDINIFIQKKALLYY